MTALRCLPRTVAARSVPTLLSLTLHITHYTLHVTHYTLHVTRNTLLTPHSFHRAVFATFDEDGNSTLDAGELDKFLDTFYEAGSIFKGDARLPEKKEDLKKMVNEKLDADGDGKFSFEEIRSLISGSAARGDLLN